MKTWKRIALALGIVAVLGGATAAIAANAHRRGNFQQRITGRVNHMLDKINATPEQRQKINDIVKQAMTDLQAQRQANAKNRGYWIQALTAEKINLDDLNSKADDHAKAMAAKKKRRLNLPLVEVLEEVLDEEDDTQSCFFCQS